MNHFANARYLLIFNLLKRCKSLDNSELYDSRQINCSIKSFPLHLLFSGQNVNLDLVINFLGHPVQQAQLMRHLHIARHPLLIGEPHVVRLPHLVRLYCIVWQPQNVKQPHPLMQPHLIRQLQVVKPPCLVRKPNFKRWPLLIDLFVHILTT